MRQIGINELSVEESEKIRAYLQKNFRVAGIEGAYLLAVPDDLLSHIQKGHPDCGPYLFAVEAGTDFVNFEMLVRSERNLHCSCTAHATREQRDYLIEIFDKMIADLEIKA